MHPLTRSHSPTCAPCLESWHDSAPKDPALGWAYAVVL